MKGREWLEKRERETRKRDGEYIQRDCKNQNLKMKN